LARIELSRAASEDLAELIRTHSLPADTAQRVTRSLRPLEQFPLMGAELGEPWDGFRFLLGPWRWLILVYAYLEPKDKVLVVTIQDGRTSSAARP
jgi:plasmid stabilization system protein ParE